MNLNPALDQLGPCLKTLNLVCLICYPEAHDIYPFAVICTYHNQPDICMYTRLQATNGQAQGLQDGIMLCITGSAFVESIRQHETSAVVAN
jgi:hypothetical protein